MDERIEIWNLLHDGFITAIERNGDTLTMFINIPYLRRRMKPIGDSFVLTLSGLSRMDFCDPYGEIHSFAEELGVGVVTGPEIISTDSDSMPITVEFDYGRLILDFQSISFALDTGSPVSLMEIEEVAAEYWQELASRAERNRGKPDRDD
jgi:hypothetical protein